MTEALSFYRDHAERYARERAAVHRRVNLISNLRLAVAVAAVAAAVMLFRAEQYTATGVAAAAGVILFIILAVLHAPLFRQRDRLDALVAVNRQGIDRCSGRWGGFPEDGREFIDHNHPYSSDLDIFGVHSLFQYLCCARTATGKKILAAFLQAKPDDATTVSARREAVAWLAERFSWRQRFESSGMVSGGGNDPEELIRWAGSSAYIYTRNVLIQKIVRFSPMLLTVPVVVWFAGGPAAASAAVVTGVQLLCSVALRGVNNTLFNLFDKHSRMLAAYGDLLAQCEELVAEPALPPLLRQHMTGGLEERASRALKKLAAAVSASEARFSPLPWLVANMLFLWDIRCAVRMELWKQRYGTSVQRWLETIGAFEALSSLALLRFDHPDWVFPRCDEPGMMLRAQALGHPLLPAGRRITNEVTLGLPGGSVCVITGSNMSGKSTLLRTVGINLVLAYAGAPVCAEEFSCPMLAVYTSMRTGDDLQSSTSTFYAELLRVKMVVDAAGEENPLLFLLDELFRGTNSTDRHDGAVALLGELSRPHTLGMISTHDLDLCSLADRNRLFTNAHFEEQYDEEGLRFDYRLRPGPSTTRNALYLMRMVGIGKKEGSDSASPESF